MASKTHVMVIPFPAQGHINPMIQFSKRLASKGLQVTLVATNSNDNSMDSHTSSINIEHISYGFDELEKPDVDGHIALHKLKVSQILPVLFDKQKSSGNPVNVLIYDSIMPWAVDISHQLGVRGAAFFTYSCAVSAIYHHFHRGTVKIPVKESMVSLPSLPVMEPSALPSFLCDVGSYSSMMNLVSSQEANFHKADWLLFNTFQELEVEVVKWMGSQWRIKTIGPTVVSMLLDKRLAGNKNSGFNEPNGETCLKWLDAKDIASVIYVSFGSWGSVCEGQMEEIAWGLMKSDSYFLWVVRDSEQNKLPTNFIEKVGEKGLIVGWCPQLEVLAHKALGCFMTHCGWNSTLEALSLGVPILVMPTWMDQNTNAKFIVDVWRTGVRVKDHDKNFKREELAVCIKDVMGGEKGDELRKNALRWKELAVKAMDEGGNSDKNIDEFISEVVCT